MKLIQFLSRWPVILTSFVVMNIVGFGFVYVQNAVGGELLDMIWNADDAKTRLLEMSADQKSTHLWATLILDSIYPLAYGSFFIGLTARLAGMKKLWLIIPAISSVFFDFLENVVQIIGLSGHSDFLAIKNVVTPLKFTSVLVAMAIAITLLVFTLIRKIMKAK